MATKTCRGDNEVANWSCTRHEVFEAVWVYDHACSGLQIGCVGIPGSIQSSQHIPFLPIQPLPFLLESCGIHCPYTRVWVLSSSSALFLLHYHYPPVPIMDYRPTASRTMTSRTMTFTAKTPTSGHRLASRVSYLNKIRTSLNISFLNSICGPSGTLHNSRKILQDSVQHLAFFLTKNGTVFSGILH